MPNTNRILEAALGYAERGWAVVRMAPGRKVPNTAHGVHDATTDRKVIERWWREVPNSNVAIATGEISGLLIVDIDSPAAVYDFQNSTGINLYATRTVRSMKGFHFYYKYPYFWNGRISNTQNRKCRVDTRSNGGLIVAPPSVVQGKVYELINDVEPIDMPFELLDILYPQRRPARMRPMHDRGWSDREQSWEGVYRKLSEAQEGNRNNLLYWASCCVCEKNGYVPDSIRDRLMEIGVSIGLSEMECERTIASAEKRIGGNRGIL